MPMILRGSPMSPFVRKTRMALLHLGLSEKITFVKADPMNPEDVLRQDNPLDSGVRVPQWVLKEF